MNRRFLILGAVALVAVGVFVAALLLRSHRSSSTNTNTPPLVVTNTNASAPIQNSTTQAAAEIRSDAVKVSEAWGSGPTGESNKRLASVDSYLTPNLQVFAEAQATKSQPVPNPEHLEAARALTEKFTDQSSDRATVEVTLQVSSTVVPTPPNAGSPEVTYRKVRLGFQKIGPDWKVSEVTDLGTVQL